MVAGPDMTPPTWGLGIITILIMCVCVFVYMCVCVWVGVCVCVWPYGAVVCAVDFQSKHCGFDPRRVRFHTSFFSFSISGWLPTAKCVCMSTCGGKKIKKIKIK